MSRKKGQKGGELLPSGTRGSGSSGSTMAARSRAAPEVDGFLLSDKLDIHEFLGRTAPFLAVSPGNASLHLYRWVHPEVTTAIRRALAESVERSEGSIKKKGVTFNSGRGLSQVDIEITRLPAQPGGQGQFLLSFTNLEQLTEWPEPWPPARGEEFEASPGEALPDREAASRESRLREAEELYRNLIAQQELTTQELEVLTAQLQASNNDLETTNFELETTNEELQASLLEREWAEKELRESEEIVKALLETAAHSIVAVDSSGHIALVNATAERMFGYRREELLGQGLEMLLPARLREIHAEYRHEYFSDPVNRRMGAGRELWALHHDGHGIPVEISLSYVTTQGKNLAVSFISDISERRAAEEARKRSEAELRLVAESVPGLFSFVDSNERYCFVNESYLQAFRLPREEIVGRTVGELLGREGYRLVEPQIKRALSGRETSFEVLMPFPWGDPTWMSVKYVPRRDERGRVEGFFVLVSDISASKELEGKLRANQQELQTLNARLIKAREEESRNLARELHDVFSQRLAGLALQLPKLKGQAVEKEIGKLARDIHRMSRQLHPSILEDLGLQAALGSEIRSFSSRHGIEVDFNCEDVPTSLPNEVALCIYRVTQEGLRNIAKHSGAKVARVDLKGDTVGLVLNIEDFGRGLDPRKTQRGLGMVSMEERIRHVEGSFSLSSRPGKGTRIEVQVPLNRRSGKKEGAGGIETDQNSNRR